MVYYQDNEIQILSELGLSLNQAKLYLAILHCGSAATAKELANASKIAREDVYRLLPYLEKKNIVTRQISYPTIYKAVPLKKAIDILLKSKQEEVREIKEQTDKFIKCLGERRYLHPEPEDNKISYFKSIRTSQLVEAWAQTKSSADVTIRSDIHLKVANNPKYEEINAERIKASERGVKIRVIIDKPEESKISEFYSTIEAPKNIESTNKIQCRFATTAPESIITIFDGKKALIWTSSEHWDLAPYIEVTCPSIVNLVKAYFSVLWQKSERHS